MQSTYQIIGLSKQEIVGHTYKTEYNTRIIHDKNSNPISVEKTFSQYVLYIGSVGDECYSITLSESDIASFGGFLCHLGYMEISKCEQTEAHKNITHIPVKPLHISVELEKNYYSEEMDVCLLGEPTTPLFAFSLAGRDESTPRGYVYVNMELFTPV